MSDPFTVSCDRCSERPVVGGAYKADGARRAIAVEPQISSEGSVRPEGASGGIVREADQLEVSFMATYLAKLRELPAIRQDLVDRVKGEISAGRYETNEKLEAALDELVKEL
jgi:hypothetical protein